MYTVICSLILSIMPLAAQADDPVNQVLDAVKRSTDASIDRWELRVESGAREGEEVNRPWTPIRLAHSITEFRYSYQATVRIPEVFAGTKITGGTADLLLTLRGPADFTAKVYVDEELKAEFPIIDPVTDEISMPPIRLTDDARPGQSFTIRISVYNPQLYPVHEFLDTTRTFTFRNAYLILEQAWEFRDELDRFAINISAADTLLTPIKMSEEDRKKRWPEFVDRSRIDPKERRQLRRLLRDSAAKFDFQALERGETERVRASIAGVLGELAPVGQFAKTFTIYCAGNAHIDLAWLWRWQETIQIAANTYRSVLTNLEEFPELIYAQSQAQTYDWIERSDPELFAGIRAAIDKGHWDPVGGMWVETDCNIPGGESWVRQLLLAQRYYADKLGRPATLGWNPDSFGYNWNMPQLFSKAGVSAFVTQKLSWNDTTVFPYHLFWWEAPDGSRILSYLPTGGYAESVIPERMMDQLMRFELNTGFREMLTLFGLGDHGGGPNRPMLQRVQMLMQQPLFPKVEYIKPHDYIELLEKKDLSDLPVWRNELYLEGHRGTLTTQSETKRNNRKGEALLETAEKASSLAAMLDADYPHDALERAWKLVLFNQFHDILPGSSITPVYRDADEDYALAKKLAGRAVDSAIDALAAKLTPTAGRPVLVFNPLSWERDGCAAVMLPDGAPQALSVLDPEGKPVPCQIVPSDDGLDRKLIFTARGVPSIGYKLFTVVEGGPQAAPPALAATGSVLENEFLRVEVNPETGNIKSIVDKRGAGELLADGREGNRIELFENIPNYWEAWNIGYTGRSWVLDKADSVELIETGPVRATIRVKKSYMGLSKANRAPTSGFPSSFFVQDIILYAGSPRVDIVLRTDWWEDRTLMKVSFPFAVESDKATYEIPFACVERPTVREEPWQKARFEVSVHRWADLSDGARGVSLLNDSKYGMDTLGGTMRLTIHTSPIWPDPMADRGRHLCAYAVYPHSGGWREAGTVRMAQEFNIPLVTRLVAPGSGELPPSRSFFGIDAPNVDLTCVKRAEDGGGYILRFVETAGKLTSVKLSLPAAPILAAEVNLLEQEIAPLQPSGAGISFAIKPYEVKSFRVDLK